MQYKDGKFKQKHLIITIFNCTGTTEDCSDHLTCAECRTESGCGWCRDESDTGLGTCGKGSFLKSLNGSFCVNTHWFYDSCPCKIIYHYTDSHIHTLINIYIY